jgi:hypothetical protein
MIKNPPNLEKKLIFQSRLPNIMSPQVLQNVRHLLAEALEGCHYTKGLPESRQDVLAGDVVADRMHNGRLKETCQLFAKCE